MEMHLSMGGEGGFLLNNYGKTECAEKSGRSVERCKAVLWV